MRASGGGQFRLAVSADGWGYRYPTPWWIRIWQSSPDTASAVRALESDPGIGYVAENQDGTIEIGIQPPLGVESDAVLAELVRVTGRVCVSLPTVDDSSASPGAITDGESPAESSALLTSHETEPP